MIQTNEITELFNKPIQPFLDSLVDVYSSKTQPLSQKMGVFEEYSFVKKHVQDAHARDGLSSITKSILNDYVRLFEETDKNLQQKMVGEISDMATDLKKNGMQNYGRLQEQAKYISTISDVLQYTSIKKELNNLFPQS